MAFIRGLLRGVAGYDVPIIRPASGGPSGAALLLEDGSYLLLENGSFLLLE